MNCIYKETIRTGQIRVKSHVFPDSMQILTIIKKPPVKGGLSYRNNEGLVSPRLKFPERISPIGSAFGAVYTNISTASV